MNEYILEEISPNTSLILKEEYAVIHSNIDFNENNLNILEEENKYATLLGKKLNEILPQLYEQELIYLKNGDFIIPYNNFKYLYNSDSNQEEIGYDLSAYLPKYSPFFIKIDSIRDLGSANFEYDYNFFWGTKQVFPHRIGCFIYVKSKIYYLEPNLYKLISTMDNFNKTPKIQKNKTFNLKKFAKIKELISKINGVETDIFLENENVILPNQIKLNIVNSERGISIEPSLENVDSRSFQKQYELLNDVQEIYDTDNNGKRTRVVLDDEIKLVAEKLKKNYTNRKLSDIERELKEPEKIFEDLEGINQDIINYEGYSERVKGIGQYAFKARGQFSTTSVHFLEDIDYTQLDDARRAEILQSLQPKLIAETIDNEIVEIPVTIEILEIMNNAIKSNNDTVKLYTSDGKEVILPINSNIIDFVHSNKELLEDNNEENIKNNIKKYLIIHDNFEEQTYSEDIKEQVNKQLVYYRPDNLNDFILNKQGEKIPLNLYDYQKEGVAWLEASFDSQQKQGALLADDMGLGKTLQVLTFLSWLIEKKEQIQEHIDPILIVAPPILLQNWYDEIQKYFKHNGSIFLPITILHGDTLKAYKKYNVGPEAIVGKSSLCVNCQECELNTERGCAVNKNSLSNNRIVITNYDTVKNYQFSLAKIKWSAVILDEAQYIKTPDTAVTKAVKALNSEFKLALTGTPVENKLLDLWSIMDFATPGLLGTRKNFSQTYDIANKSNAEEKKNRLTSLKETLKLVNFKGLNQLNVIPHVVRREKIDYLSDKLPLKHDGKDAIRIECEIPNDMAEIHQALIKQVAMSSGNQYLMIIQQLTKLYQHKYLLDTSKRIYTVDEYLKASPKLQSTLEVLKQIQEKGEKVLIFLTSRNMQNILKKVIDNEFKINVDIINGTVNNSTSSDPNNKGARHRILERFEEKNGFNVLILSPHVAGTGLTILGANHVIHYGRWWNPAKESQATDRAYRIGQKKEVYVYYPVYKSKYFETFDEKLDRLIEAKRALARDFLTPISELEVTAGDILKDYINETPNIKIAAKCNIKFTELEDIEFKKLVYLILQKQSRNVKYLEKETAFGLDLMITENDNKELIKTYNHEIDENEVDLFIQNIHRYNKNGQNNIYINANISKNIINYAKENEIQIYGRKDLEPLVKSFSITHSQLISVIPETCNLI